MKRWQFILGLAVSALFVWISLRGIDLRRAFVALQQANYWWLIPCVLITVALLFLKGWRWQLMFLPEYRLPYWSVYTAMCAGYLANNVLPGRAGELIRLVCCTSSWTV